MTHWLSDGGSKTFEKVGLGPVVWASRFGSSRFGAGRHLSHERWLGAALLSKGGGGTWAESAEPRARAQACGHGGIATGLGLHNGNVAGCFVFES